MIRLFPIVIALLVLVSCCDRTDNENNQYYLKTWQGTWEDGTGFWLKIKVNGEDLVFERSGEQPDSPTKFTVESISEDYSEIRIIERSDYAHYRHTLKLTKDNQLQRESYDLDQNAVWGNDILNKN
ncbi:hypothetical protein Rhal01_03688 [Rubritalea halochordaticola]|uniref:Lipoprotein n=1 Tax=Rubritalea halochordaticola TaxID=714537 RepID=A0ABP9V803_9BACT